MKFMSLISQSSQRAQRHLVMYVNGPAPLRKDSIVPLTVLILNLRLKQIENANLSS